jgi:hypothetical protein
MGKGENLLVLLLLAGVAFVLLGSNVADHTKQLENAYLQTASNDSVFNIVYNESRGEFVAVGTNQTFDLLSFVDFGDVVRTGSPTDMQAAYFELQDNSSYLLVFNELDDVFTYLQGFLQTGKAKAYLYVDEVNTDLGTYRNVYVQMDSVSGWSDELQAKHTIYCYGAGKRDMTCYFDLKNKSANVSITGDMEIISYSEFSGNLWEEFLHDILNVFGLYDHIAFSTINAFETNQVHLHASEEINRLPVGKNLMLYAYASNIVRYDRVEGHYDGFGLWYSSYDCAFANNIFDFECSHMGVVPVWDDTVASRCRRDDGKCDLVS